MTEKNCTNCKHSACYQESWWWCHYKGIMPLDPEARCEHWEAME